MIHGISGTPIPKHLRYAEPIQAACTLPEFNFPPCFAYAVGWRESICGEVNGKWNACTVVAPDFGYGLFQITYPFEQPWPPANWEDPVTNVTLALRHFLVPGLKYFTELGVSGDTLVVLTAAGYNSGNATAWANHLAGNADSGTSDNYGASVLANYHRLINGQDPQ